MKLIIIRHGDPFYDIDSLTATGWQEADLLAERISKLDVKAFYVSPMGRAQDTALKTLRKMDRKAEVLPWLREFSPHITHHWSPRPTCVWDWLPQDWTAEPRFYDPNAWYKVPIMAEAGVEEEYKWVIEGFDSLLANHGYVRSGNFYKAENPSNDTIVLFCHFGLECVLLSHLLNISPMVLWHGTCAAPSSVTTVYTEERREGIASFRMASFGDISHLYVADQEPAFAGRFCECFTNTDQRHD
jgi:probable phosphoglycerate mutase